MGFLPKALCLFLVLIFAASANGYSYDTVADVFQNTKDRVHNANDEIKDNIKAAEEITA